MGLSCYIYRRYLDKGTVIRYFAMAAKRVTATAVNWAEFASKIPAANKASFNALKNKQDGYIRAVNQLPKHYPPLISQGIKEEFLKPWSTISKKSIKLWTSHIPKILLKQKLPQKKLNKRQPTINLLL